MNEFRKPLTVDVHDVDYNGICRTSALMRYIQSAAQSQLTENGMSYDRLKERGYAFLLSRIRMEFTETVHAYEPLTAITFPCESRGYSFLRCYGVERDGRMIGRAVAIWALMDIEKRSLVRVNDFQLNLPLLAPMDLTLDRFTLPATLSEVGTYRVCYGQTDQNRHMNNTQYPDIYADFLPLEGRRIDSISINYAHEAPLGTTLRVLRAGEGDTYGFRTLLPDGRVNSEAEIHLAPI